MNHTLAPAARRFTVRTDVRAGLIDSSGVAVHGAPTSSVEPNDTIQNVRSQILIDHTGAGRR